MDKKKPETTGEFLDLLNEALTDTPAGSLEELKAELREEGVDPNQVIQGVMRLVEQAFPRETWQERARRERARMLRKLKLTANKQRADPAVIQRRLSQIQSQPLFHKFKRVTSKDMESLLEDEELLRQLEEMEQDESGGK